MKRALVTLSIVSAGLLPRVVSAQDTIPLPAAAPSAFGQPELVASIILLAASFLLLVAIGKANAIRKRREGLAVELEARVREALLREEAFFRSVDCPTVRVPLWTTGPLAVELAGPVPTRERERTALRLAEEAVAALRPAVRIENRMTVDSSSARRGGAVERGRPAASRLAGAVGSVVSVVGMLVGSILFRYAFLVDHFNLN